MKLSIIVAMARHGVIGNAGELPWRLSDDLKRFKKRTMGHAMLMGRKTYESIGRPLPGRLSLVLSHKQDYVPSYAEGTGENPGRAIVKPSLVEALKYVETLDDYNNKEVFVIGGAEIYEMAVGYTDTLYITRVDAVVQGDTFFPPLDITQWRKMESEFREPDEKNDHPVYYERYENIRLEQNSTGSETDDKK